MNVRGCDLTDILFFFLNGSEPQGPMFEHNKLSCAPTKLDKTLTLSVSLIISVFYSSPPISGAVTNCLSFSALFTNFRIPYLIPRNVHITLHSFTFHLKGWRSAYLPFARDAIEKADYKNETKKWRKSIFCCVEWMTCRRRYLDQISEQRNYKYKMRRSHIR